MYNRLVTTSILISLVLVGLMYPVNSHQPSIEYPDQHNKFSGHQSRLDMFGVVDGSGKGFDVVNYLSSIEKSIIRLRDLSSSRKAVMLSEGFVLPGYETPSKITLDAVSEVVSIEPVWDQGVNGTGVTIGLIDSGVDTNHPSLSSKVITSRSFVLTSLGYEEDEGPSDNNGHGTSVASLLVGEDDANNFRGMAFGAKIVSAKVASALGFITPAGILSALDWLIWQEKVDIISISLSEPEAEFGIDIYEKMVKEATDRGITVVASAGNRGGSKPAPHSVGSPGSSPDAVTVGSADTADQISDFSSQGPTYGYETKPDIVAPGSYILTASMGSNSYHLVSGTSFSTPLVAGIIASIKSYRPSLNPGNLKTALLRSASRVSGNLFKEGVGMANATAFLDAVRKGNDDIFVYNQSNYLTPVPQNVQIQVPLTVISGDLTKWSVEANSSLVDYSVRYSGHSSVIELDLDFSQLELGFTTVEISVFSDQLSSTVIMKFEIKEPVQGKVLLDLTHTPWDSVFDSQETRHLERIYGPDLTAVIQQIESQNYWVQELLGHSLDEVDLDKFDLVWLPSAFSQPLPLFFGRATQFPGTVTAKEVFSLYDYWHTGGSIIMDFDGTSSYDNLFSRVETDESSLQSFLSIFGVRQSSLDLIEDPQALSSSSHPFGNFSIPTSSALLDGGFSLTRIDEGSGAVMATNKGGGQLVVFNSRNWRTSPEIDSYNLHPFIQGIIRHTLSDHLITQFSMKRIFDTELDVTLGVNFGDDVDFTVSVNQRTVAHSNIKASNDYSLMFQASEGDWIDITANNGTTVLSYSTRVDTMPPELEVHATQYTDDRFQVSLSIEEASSIYEQNVLITDPTGQPLSYDVDIDLSVNELVLNVFEEKDNMPKSLSIRVLDAAGNQASIEFDVNLDDTTTDGKLSDIQKSSTEIGLNFVLSPLTTVIVGIIVSRMRKRYTQKY